MLKDLVAVGKSTYCGWDAIEIRLPKLLTIDRDLSIITPNIAKSYAVSDDSTNWVQVSSKLEV